MGRLKSLLGYKISLKDVRKRDLKELQNIFINKKQRCYIVDDVVYFTPGTNSIKRDYNKYKRLLEIKMYLQQFGLDKVAQPVRF